MKPNWTVQQGSTSKQDLDVILDFTNSGSSTRSYAATVGVFYVSALIMPRPLGRGIKQWCCLTSVWRLTIAPIVNIHGAHSYWKQGALGAAGQA